MQAIILAGGKGTRLLPYTAARPKALMPVGPYLLLEIILRQLKAAGFQRATLCISHLGDAIREEFEDGAGIGLPIDYSVDSQPLGTAGPLRGVPEWRSPALVMNCDILSSIDFAAMYRAHMDSRWRISVAVARRYFPIDWGVVTLDGSKVADIAEKPRMVMDISTGIYVVDPSVREHLAPDTPTDMPDLVRSVMRKDHGAGAYRFDGSWYDVGTPHSYEQAQAEFESSPDRYLPRAPVGSVR
jgi:NDP-mannose synthase